MKPWVVLGVDSTDNDTSLLHYEDFDTKSEAEAKYKELKGNISNVYLVHVIKQLEYI